MSEALETSSPATLALAKANGSLRKRMATSSLKNTWAATSSLQAMLSMGQEVEEPVEEEEEDFGFPSIEWLKDDAPQERPLNVLSGALSIINEGNGFQAPKSQANKRRRVGESQGLVRSKAMKSDLSSLVSSCAKESSASVITSTKFVLGAWGGMVTARDLSSNLATCSLKTSPFVDNSAVNTGLLTV